MWTYNDPKWEEEIIPGVTYRDAAREFDGLKSLHHKVQATKLDSASYQRLKKVCSARRAHSNAPPIGFRPVPEKEAAERFFLNSPFYMEYRQLHPWDVENNRLAPREDKIWPWEEEGYEGYAPPKSTRYRHHNGSMIPARLFYMWDGTGWAISHDYSGGHILWFRFGCEHKWGPPPKDTGVVIPRLFRCQSFYYCVKCGHSEVIDSSD